VDDEKRSGPTAGAVLAPEPSGHAHQKEIGHREEVPAFMHRQGRAAH
jgi:hypothetical protein